MSESLDSIRQRARQKAAKSKLEHQQREQSLRSLGNKLRAEVSDEAMKLKSSTIRPLRVGLILALVLLLAQSALLFLSPQLIPKAKLWIDPPNEAESQITIQQLRTYHPNMSETDLILVRGLENLAKEHDARLSELEASLTRLLESGEERTKDDQALSEQLKGLQSSVRQLITAHNSLSKSYSESMTSISARLDRLESR